MCGGGRRAAVVLDVADLLLRPSAFGVAIAQPSAIRHARRGARHLVPLTLAVRGGHGHGGAVYSCHDSAAPQPQPASAELPCEVTQTYPRI